MNQLIFSKEALVEIQGDDVLELQTLSDDHVTYQVVGFNDPCIIINDYRPDLITDIKQCLEKGQLDGFAERFNKSSRIMIRRESQKIVVDLHQGSNTVPRFMLWVASEMFPRVPLFRYRIFKSIPTSQGKYKLFSLYKRPYQRGKHEPVPFLL